MARAAEERARRPESVTEKQPSTTTANSKFKKGDRVAIATHGAGVISYEPNIVERIRRGVVYLENNDDFVFDANSGQRTKCEPSPFGFRFELLPKAEVPADEWRRVCKECGVAP